MTDPIRSPRSFAELYAEIERLPEGMTGEILEEDVVGVMSRPGKRHRRAGRKCLEALAGLRAAAVRDRDRARRLVAARAAADRVMAAEA